MSLPSPFDPIHHGLRHLDMSGANSTDTDNSMDAPLEAKFNGIPTPPSKTVLDAANAAPEYTAPTATAAAAAPVMKTRPYSNSFTGSSANLPHQPPQLQHASSRASLVGRPLAPSEVEEVARSLIQQLSINNSPRFQTASTMPFASHPAPTHDATRHTSNAPTPDPKLTSSAIQSGSSSNADGIPSSEMAADHPQSERRPSIATPADKPPEHLLDQQLLSSQKVPTYRSDDSVLADPSTLASGYLARLFGLHGQVAIVTGAARGIGLALARGLAMAGARVCMADMNIEQVTRESSLLNDELKDGEATFPLCVDVTKRDSIVNMFTTTVERYGLLSICVNNAGLAISGEDPKRNYSESFSEEDFDMTINLNLKAVFFCCQFAARWMIANSVMGSIINVASMSAKVVNWPQRQSVYNASKAAVVQLTKCLAVEWCSYGIRVNCISPGYIDTPLNRQISIAHLRHEWTKKTPQHRLGDPRDLVAAVIYLASSRASAFTTGEDIVIDGGYTLW